LNRWIPLTLVLMLSAVLVWMLFGWKSDTEDADPYKALQLAQPPRGGDFTLTSAAGPVSLADFRGKVVLIYFGYTWCPDICPLNLSYLRYALDGLTAQERERVQVLFISVDPERDTPQRLSRYTAYFAPDILGLTGMPEEVAKAAALYGAVYRRGEVENTAMGYAVDHSAYTYLVDTSGALQQSFDHATPPDRIIAAIRSQLTAGETP